MVKWHRSTQEFPAFFFEIRVSGTVAKRTHGHHKNESETPLDCGVRVDGRILQAIEKRQETTPIYRNDVMQNREFQTRT